MNQEKCVGCRRCVYSCPFGGVSVDFDKGVAVKCMLCDGDPQCVQFCAFDALKYVRADKIDIKQKRKGAAAFLKYQKQVLAEIASEV